MGSGQCVLGNCQELCLDAKELYDGYGVTYLNVEKSVKMLLCPMPQANFMSGRRQEISDRESGIFQPSANGQIFMARIKLK